MSFSHPLAVCALILTFTAFIHKGCSQFVGKCPGKFFYKPNTFMGYIVNPCAENKFAQCIPSLYSRKNCSAIPQPPYTSPFGLNVTYRGGRSRLIKVRVAGYSSSYKSTSLERLFIEARKVDGTGRLRSERIGSFTHADSQCDPESCCDPDNPDLANVAIECAMPFSTSKMPFVLPEYDWTAPKSLKSGSIQFIATFIQSSEKHWADVKSRVIKFKLSRKRNKMIYF